MPVKSLGNEKLLLLSLLYIPQILVYPYYYLVGACIKTVIQAVKTYALVSLFSM